jgi:hypothetical protein
MTTRVVLALTSLLSVAAVALAQDRPPAAVDPKACAPGERTLPGAASPGATSNGRSSTAGENLSDKLARTDGVICPPNVDQAIKAPTPEVGNMPIIPPPGSPGGDQTVRPK